MAIVLARPATNETMLAEEQEKVSALTRAPQYSMRARTAVATVAASTGGTRRDSGRTRRHLPRRRQARGREAALQ
eukprot:1008190-Prorocentrum_minimum.AAC.1